jgi:hypothetical protein
VAWIFEPEGGLVKLNEICKEGYEAEEIYNDLTSKFEQDADIML